MKKNYILQALAVLTLVSQTAIANECTPLSSPKDLAADIYAKIGAVKAISRFLEIPQSYQSKKSKDDWVIFYIYGKNSFLKHRNFQIELCDINGLLNIENKEIEQYVEQSGSSTRNREIKSILDVGRLGLKIIGNSYSQGELYQDFYLKFDSSVRVLRHEEQNDFLDIEILQCLWHDDDGKPTPEVQHFRIDRRNSEVMIEIGHKTTRGFFNSDLTFRSSNIYLDNFDLKYKPLLEE